MRLHRFYISEKIGTKTEITVNSVELVNQIQRVFRLKKGDRVITFDGSGFDFECEIIGLEKETIILKVIKSEPSRFVPKKEVYLYQALVKKDNFEWIVEKATELGVTHVVPVMAERSEKKSLNEERLKKIAIEASEQSSRSDIPTIGNIVKLEDAILAMSDIANAKRLVFHTEGSILAMSDIAKTGPIAVFIGPEGGWSEKEIELFHKNNMDIICLGNQVLRSETAVIAALSQVVF